MKQPTDEQTITLGLMAESLMNDDAFNELYELVEDRIAKEILATPLADKETRELLYQTYNGMRAFVQYINQFRTAKDQVVERLNAENEEKEHEDY